MIVSFRMLSDDVSGYENLWFIGDTFLATTFREHFKKEREYNFYCKENFDVSAYCSSRQCEKDQNIVRRIKNSLVAGLNKHWKLPKYLVILLDADIIDFLCYTNIGIAGFYGEIVESVIKCIREVISMRKESLPTKAVKQDFPYIYWVSLPQHRNFDNKPRSKFNLTMDSIIKLHPDMRLILIKEHWDYNNENLVQNDRFTGIGCNQYWKAIDASLKFNISKREKIIGKNPNAKVMMKSIMSRKDPVKFNPKRKFNKKDGVPAFFSKYRKVVQKNKKDGKRLPEP